MEVLADLAPVEDQDECHLVDDAAAAAASSVELGPCPGWGLGKWELLPMLTAASGQPLWHCHRSSGRLAYEDFGLAATRCATWVGLLAENVRYARHAA